MTPFAFGVAIFAALAGSAGIAALVVAVARDQSRGRVVAASVTALLWLATIAQLTLPDGGAPWSGALMTVVIPATLALYPDAGSAGPFGWVVSAFAVALGALFAIRNEALASSPGWVTNQAIAARLSISSKTVANYVASVKVKLGIHSRRDVARILRGN